MTVNKARPEITLTLSGKDYTGVFSTAAFCALEEKTGLNALDGATWQNINLSTVTVMIWAALRTHHPEITLDFVRDNLDLSDIPNISAKLEEGFLKASPGPQIEEKKTENQ